MSSERKTVQVPMMKYAGEIGWQYLTPEEALRQRRGDTGRFLRDTLETQLLRLNPGVLNAQRVEEVLRRLSPRDTQRDESKQTIRGATTIS